MVFGCSSDLATWKPWVWSWVRKIHRVWGLILAAVLAQVAQPKESLSQEMEDPVQVVVPELELGAWGIFRLQDIPPRCLFLQPVEVRIEVILQIPTLALQKTVCSEELSHILFQFICLHCKVHLLRFLHYFINTKWCSCYLIECCFWSAVWQSQSRQRWSNQSRALGTCAALFTWFQGS